MGNDVEIMGIKEVNEKFEIENPKQVIDYLGICLLYTSPSPRDS